jgi:hypothetical protein
VLKNAVFGASNYTSAVWIFGSRHRLQAAAGIKNCDATFASPRSLVWRIPPVCFIHPKAFSIQGRTHGPRRVERGRRRQENSFVSFGSALSYFFSCDLRDREGAPGRFGCCILVS